MRFPLPQNGTQIQKTVKNEKYVFNVIAIKKVNKKWFNNQIDILHVAQFLTYLYKNVITICPAE